MKEEMEENSNGIRDENEEVMTATQKYNRSYELIMNNSMLSKLRI